VPERVTKEEIMVSLAIEKARDAKEILYQSLYDNNRLPDEKDDRVEQVKIKRPKAENDKTKIENNDGTHSGYGKGGEETHFKKAVRRFNNDAKSFYQQTLANMRTLPNKQVQNNFEYELDRMSQQKGGTPLTYADVNNAKIMVSKSGYSRS
jgi:hypothetical protein